MATAERVCRASTRGGGGTVGPEGGTGGGERAVVDAGGEDRAVVPVWGAVIAGRGPDLSQEGRVTLPTNTEGLTLLSLAYNMEAVAMCDAALAAAGYVYICVYVCISVCIRIRE